MRSELAPSLPEDGAARKTGGWRRLLTLLRIELPGEPELRRRIRIMERDLILPIKLAAIAMLVRSFFLAPSPWIGSVLGALEIAIESTQYLLFIYIGINVVMTAILLLMRRLPLGFVSWTVFMSCLVDGIFLGALTLVTGGYDSFLYWLFLALIVRGAVSVPQGTSQLMLNLTLSACYVFAGIIDLKVADNLDERTRQLLDLTREGGTEPLVLRLILLLLMIICCYGVQVLLKRQREALAEAREFAVREGQLRSAGRLAAEFAHQIKNPLAIINNAAYSLERAIRNGKGNVSQQIEIIQEEVARSDRILTDIMGYAQLSEGRVEKLDVLEEIENAIKRVFPPGAEYPVKLETDLGRNIPPLLMQRRHFSEAIVNVLLNAREALEQTGGRIGLRAHMSGSNQIEIIISDSGPGIPPDRLERVFEAYYTTKVKGTGIGLATVKHNVELYAGTVKVESELGKGATFILRFPAKTLDRDNDIE